MIKIPKEMTIVGSLISDKDVEVSARVKGNSNVKGILIINRDCEWTGNPVADHIIIEGYVKGDIIARKKIEIKPSATVEGSITAPQAIIPKSAKLDCLFNMSRKESAKMFTQFQAKKEPANSEATSIENDVALSA